MPRKWRIDLREGEEIPRGYGIAYRDWSCKRTVAMPMPFNVVFAVCRAAVIWLKFVPYKWLRHDRNDLYWRGWNDGYAQGRFDYRYSKMEGHDDAA